LRAILKRNRLWAEIAPDVKMLRERSDTGRALSLEDDAKLLDAIAQSPSPALYPFFVLTLDSGLRPSETRALRRRDLNLVWRDGLIAEGEIVVAHSKTEAGTGRVIPLTRRAAAALTLCWRASPKPARIPTSFRFITSALPGTPAILTCGESTSTAPWERTATSAPTKRLLLKLESITGSTTPAIPS
jgi:integrase